MAFQTYSPVNAAETNPASPAAAATILPANGKRVGLIITNTGGTTLYVLLDNSAAGVTVSSTRYTVSIAAGASWACPFNFQGNVQAIAAAVASGNVQVTEFALA